MQYTPCFKGRQRGKEALETTPLYGVEIPENPATFPKFFSIGAFPKLTGFWEMIYIHNMMYSKNVKKRTEEPLW
jgi:hypothetical protein